MAWVVLTYQTDASVLIELLHLFNQHSRSTSKNGDVIRLFFTTAVSGGSPFCCSRREITTIGII